MTIVKPHLLGLGLTETILTYYIQVYLIFRHLVFILFFSWNWLCLNYFYFRIWGDPFQISIPLQLDLCTFPTERISQRTNRKNFVSRQFKIFLLKWNDFEHLVSKVVLRRDPDRSSQSYPGYWNWYRRVRICSWRNFPRG